MMELRSFRISVRDEPCSAFSVSLSNLSSVSRLIDVNPSGTFNPVMGDAPCGNARSCKAERRMAHGLSSAVTPRLKAREGSNPGYWWWAGRRDFGHAPRDRSRWFLRSRSSASPSADASFAGLCGNDEYCYAQRNKYDERCFHGVTRWPPPAPGWVRVL